MVSVQGEQLQQSGLSDDEMSKDTINIYIHHENYNIEDYDPRWEKLKKLKFSD